MKAPSLLAIDLGAESGRAAIGCFDGERVDVREIHRFQSQPLMSRTAIAWDMTRIMEGVTQSIGSAAQSVNGALASIGVDAWGVDFGLLDDTGSLIENPRHYRDPRTKGIVDQVGKEISLVELYRRTGIQFLNFNTVFQLAAIRGSDALDRAQTLLFIPDLVTYLLTGEGRSERTIASTSQLVDIETGSWNQSILEQLRIPSAMFRPIIEPGTIIGETSRALSNTGAIQVVAVAGHDTASAVLAVPAATERFAYVSSGTWSLVGIETARPIVTEEARLANFTNEAGFAGTNRFLKNVSGLWIVQECRHTWERQGRTFGYDELTQLASESTASNTLIDPSHPSFVEPEDMPRRIRDFCFATQQDPPTDAGAYVRVVLTSLALAYARVIDRAQVISGRDIDVVHVVGGGARNALLCQLTADATRLPVVAGPAEASTIGNIMAQIKAHGWVDSIADIRAIVRCSVSTDRYEPRRDQSWWDEARARFARLAMTTEGDMRV